MTAGVDIRVGLQSDEALNRVSGAVGDVQKSLNMLNGAFGNYERRLGGILKQLELVTRSGQAAGQTVRDLQLVAGGSNVAGRVRQSLARGQISDMKQIEEVLASSLINAQRQILKDVTKSVQSALVRDLARSRQGLASLEADIRSAQIEAQQARVAYAAQLSGSRGLNRARMVQNGNSLGLENIGSLRQEKAALESLLQTEQRISAENATQLRDTRALLGMEERLKRITDERFATLRQANRAAGLSQAMGQANISMTTASARGDQAGVVGAQAKREALRLEQMILQGVREESAEYQKQLGVIRNLANEKERLRQAQAKITADVRDQTRLENSQKFRDGDPTMRQTAINNMIGGRRAAASDEGRASLLGLQSNLLLNYALIGTVTGAITGMTSAVIDLDAQLRQLQAISGATNVEYGRLRETILETSEDTKFSAVELAEGATLLAQVGLSAQQIGEVLPAISNFAMAVGTDMKNAVDITTTALTVFNLATGETERVTNVLTEALNRSKLSMDQLVLGFQYAANITADAGGTFEELTAVLAGMSQAGIRSGSMLGTGLRQIMISLASPTEEVKNLLQDLGLTMNDVDVRTQGLVGVIQNFADAGITASQAMGAFETRTAAALIAATNQVGFMRDLQEQMIYTNAAEEAALVQKDALKNSALELRNGFLSFLNDAAMPVVAMLVQLAQGLKTVGAVLEPIAPLLTAIGTSLLLFVGAAAIGSIVNLTTAFLRFSGVLGPTATAVGGLTIFMRAYAAQVLLVAKAEGVAAAATYGFRAALTALAAHPAMIAMMAVVGVLGLLTNGFGMVSSEAERHRETMDVLKSEYDDSQAKMTGYQEVLGQIEATLARLSSRSETLRDDQQGLRIETMNAAVQFNQYGASIRSTSMDLEGLTASLYRARQGVLDLMYAEAQRAGNAAERQAAASSTNLINNARAATGNNFGTRMAGRPEISRSEFISLLEKQRRAGRITREEMVGYARDFGTVEGTGRRSGPVSGEGAIQANMASSNVARILQQAAESERIPELRDRYSRVAGRFGDVGGFAAQTASQRAISSQARSQVGQLGVRRTPEFQALERGATPSMSASVFQSQLDNIAAMTRLGRRPDGTPYSAADAQRDRTSLYAQARSAIARGQAGADELRLRAMNSGDPNFQAAAQTVLSGSGQAAQNELISSVRNAGRNQDESDLANFQLFERALKGNAPMDQVLATANAQGISLPSDRAGALNYVQTQKAAIESGYSMDQRLGTNSPLTALKYGTERLAATAPGRGGGGGDAASEAENAARDAKRLNDAAASSFKRLSDASEKSADLILKDLDEGTTPEQQADIMRRAQEAFSESEQYQEQYYSTKLEGLKEYREALLGAGAITESELADLNAEIVNTEVEMAEAIAVQKEEITDKMVTALQRVPEIGKPFTTLLDLVDDTLKNLEVALGEALAELNQATANREASGGMMGILARQGRVSSSIASAYDNRYQRRIDSLELGSTDERLFNLRGRQASIGNALSSSVTVGGQSIPLEQIDRVVASQRELLSTLESGTTEFGLQKARLLDLEAVQQRIYELRQEDLTVSQQIAATMQAQADAAEAQALTLPEMWRTVTESWMDTNGYAQDPITSMLDGLPGILDQAQTSLGGFFSSVLSGTASVGDAFRTMAGEILDAMMNVVASEIAKSFLRMAMGALGGGSWNPGGTPFGGGPVPEFYREGGLIRAAGGYGVRGRDSVPIMAMPGEYVLRKSAVDAIGMGNLDQLNAQGNRAVSGQGAPKPVMIAPPKEERPLSIYVVSPDQTPPPSRDEIIVMVQDDMINRGPIYKTTKAVQQGVI